MTEKVMLLGCCLGVTAMLILGCEAQGVKAAPAEEPKLCAACGHIKGSPECCQPGMPRCPQCGLIAGSPGCCKIPPGTTEDVALCTKCGHIKGSPQCCQPGAERCPKCGLAKGSPGCCRIAQVRRSMRRRQPGGL